MRRVKFIFLLLVLFAFVFVGTFVQAADNVQVEVTSYFDSSNEIKTTVNATYGNKMSFSGDLQSNSAYEFAFWIKNGKVQSNELDYDFTVTENTKLKGIFKPKGQYAVVFMDTNGDVLKVQHVNSNEAVSDAGIVLPSKPGYAIAPVKWDKSLNNITSDTIVTLQYEKEKTDTYTLTVEGGMGSSETAHFNDIVEVVAAEVEAGKYFKYWQVENRIASNQPRYQFTMFDDVTITAVYGDEEALELPLVSLSGKISLREDMNTFVGQYYLPEGYTLIEYGILTSDIEEALTFETLGVSKYQGGRVNPDTNEYVMTFPENTSVSARAYLVYKDSEGNIGTTYNGFVQKDIHPSVTIEGTAQVSGIDTNGYDLNETIAFAVVDTAENAEVKVTVNGVALEAVDGIYSYVVVDSNPVEIHVRAIDLSKASLKLEYDSSVITADGITASTEIDGCDIGEVITFNVIHENYTGYAFVGVLFNGETLEPQDGSYSVVLVSGENQIEILTEELVGVNYQKTLTTAAGAYSANDDKTANDTKNAVLVSKVGFIPGNPTSLLNKNGTFDIVELRSRADGFLVYARINATVQNGVVTKLTLTNRGGTAASKDYVYTDAVWNLLINNNLTIVCVRTNSTHFTVYSDNGFGVLVKMIEYDMTGMTENFTQFGIGVQSDPTSSYSGDTLKLNLTWYANLTDFSDVAELAEFANNFYTLVELGSEGVKVSGITPNLLNAHSAGTEVTFTVAPMMFSGIASIDAVYFNNELLTANGDGSYTVTISKGVNIIDFETTAINKASGTIIPDSGNSDQLIKTPIQNAFGTNKTLTDYVLVTKVKYANVKTEVCLNDDDWAMDIRFNNGGFYALATIRYTNNGTIRTLSLGSRSVKSDCSDFGQFASENIDAILDMIQSGTFTIVVVAKGSNISLYADNGSGELVKMYTYTKAYSISSSVDNKIAFAQWGTKAVAGSTNSAYGVSWALYEGSDFTVCSELLGLSYTPEE